MLGVERQPHFSRSSAAALRLESDPVDAERELLDGFEATMGRLPPANLVRGTRAAVAA